MDNLNFFYTVTLIGSLLVSQGQKGASNMWPLKTITRGHGGSEQLPSAEGRGWAVVMKHISPLQRAVVVERLIKQENLKVK